MNLIQISKLYEKDNSLTNYKNNPILYSLLNTYSYHNNLYMNSENYIDFSNILINKNIKKLSILYNKSITKDLSKFDFEVYYKPNINNILENDDFEYHDYYINDTSEPDFSLHGLYDVLVGEIGTVIITRKMRK